MTEQILEERPNAGELMVPMIRKSLEDVLVQTERLSGGKFHRDLKVFEDIARKFEFSELTERIDEVYKRIGSSIAIKKQEKVEKDRREDDFEKYMARDNNLEKVESGLRFLNRQHRLKSGRPDLRARDKEEKTVYLELKMNDEDVHSVIREVYRHLNGDKNARVIVVAPEIKPRLFFTFEQFIDNGRLSLYEVEEVTRGQDYRIKRFDSSRLTEEDKTEAEKPLERTRKKKIDTGIVDCGGSKSLKKNGSEKNNIS